MKCTFHIQKSRSILEIILLQLHILFFFGCDVLIVRYVHCLIVFFCVWGCFSL